MKIIAEDAYHRPSVADKLVATGIPDRAEAEVMLRALMMELSAKDCRHYRIVHEDFPLYEPS